MNTLILGYGKTGRAVHDYIGDQSNIIVYDDILSNEEIDGLIESANLKGGKAPVFFNKINEKVFFGKYLKDITQCVVSPGIERNHKVILELKKYNIPIYGEIEFAYRMLKLKKSTLPAKIIAITGTNGKTTATTLCESAVKKAGLSEKIFVGGNLGVPFISGINDFNDFILEVSSFQLEWIYDFKPDIAVLLNVEDDHLDRYENADEYKLTKYKLFKNLRYNDVAILNYDDYDSAILKDIVGSKAILFGFDENKCNVYFKGDAINLRLKNIIGFDAVIPLKNIKLRDKRRFVIYDMMAAACSLVVHGISPDIVTAAFENYESPEHRVEYVGNVGGIEFYDDSKATNPAAVISALKSLSEDGENRDIVLILGGKDKGFDYESLILSVKNNNVRTCVLIGETRGIIGDTLKGNVELITAAGNMESAVKEAFFCLINNNERTGTGTVLLSPASSSFDMFKDYNERGDIFKKCYLNLKNNFI